jgi:integrase/recombinase XerD
MGYRTYLLNARYRPGTINNALAAISAYCEYLKETGRLGKETSILRKKKDWIRNADDPNETIEVFSESEIAQILFYVKQEKVSCRNRLIVYLLMYTGMRISEICNLKLADIDLEKRIISVVGKGNIYRKIPLRKDVVHTMKEYVEKEREKSKFSNSDYFIVTQRSAKMDRSAILTWCWRVSAELGFRIYPHKFRHTFCTRLIQLGVPIVTVSKLVGHASPQMTARYYVKIGMNDKCHAIYLL